MQTFKNLVASVSTFLHDNEWFFWTLVVVLVLIAFVALTKLWNIAFPFKSANTQAVTPERQYLPGIMAIVTLIIIGGLAAYGPPSLATSGAGTSGATGGTSASGTGTSGATGGTSASGTGTSGATGGTSASGTGTSGANPIRDALVRLVDAAQAVDANTSGYSSKFEARMDPEFAIVLDGDLLHPSDYQRFLGETQKAVENLGAPKGTKVTKVHSVTPLSHDGSQITRIRVVYDYTRQGQVHSRMVMGFEPSKGFIMNQPGKLIAWATNMAARLEDMLDPSNGAAIFSTPQSGTSPRLGAFLPQL